MDHGWVIRRYVLSDAEREFVRPVLPASLQGRKRVVDRRVLNGIGGKFLTGTARRDVPERYGPPWATLHTCFRGWTADGTFERMLKAAQAQTDAVGDVDRWCRSTPPSTAPTSMPPGPAECYRAAVTLAIDPDVGVTLDDNSRPARRNRAPMSFTDPVEPVGHLKAPSRPQEFSQGVVGDSVETVSDFLSPSEWVLGVIEFALGTNPLEQAISWFTGDWESYVRCAEMWRNTGRFTQDLATNLRSGNRKLDAGWNGNAADSAYVYFDELAKKIDSLDGHLQDLRTSYLDVARAIARGAELIKGVLEQLADRALILEIELTAGTALVETGVGLVAGYGAAVLQMAEMVRTWGRATEAYSAVQDAIDEATVAGGLAVGGLGVVLKEFPEPGRSYDNPAV
ncbi:transposase [Streptomyces sp. NPDC001260]|uniref:transposase n=1 Tax=Streptomyces sp. NPDC001260 TaxID=3364551 RepID=UPI0036BC7BD4